MKLQARSQPQAAALATAAAVSLSLLLHGSVPLFGHQDAPPLATRVEMAVHWQKPKEPPKEKAPKEPKEELRKKKAAKKATPAEVAARPKPQPKKHAPQKSKSKKRASKRKNPALPPTSPAEVKTKKPDVVKVVKAVRTKRPTDPRKLKAQRRTARKIRRADRMRGAQIRLRAQALERQRRQRQRRQAQNFRRQHYAQAVGAGKSAVLVASKKKGPGKANAARKKAKKKRVIPPALWHGKPEEVWACEADSRGFLAQVTEEEPLSDWVSLVPTVMFTFPTDPGLTGWMNGVSRIKKRNRRLIGRQAPIEMALPRTPIEIAFEDPEGGKAWLGRADARCLVGFRWNGKKLWPFTVYRLPAEFEAADGTRTKALVNVSFYEDATVVFKPHDKNAPPLALARGRLLGGDLIEDTIAGHLGAARLAKTVSSWIGLDLRSFSTSGRRAQARERARKQQAIKKAKAREAQTKLKAKAKRNAKATRQTKAKPKRNARSRSKIGRKKMIKASASKRQRRRTLSAQAASPSR